MKTKNLFKFALIMVLIFAFAFVFNTTVKATTALDDINEDLQGITKTDNGDSSYTLKVNDLTLINLEIKSGEKVTLDLNGKSLDNTATEGMPTILVDQGAELTIIDSGEGGYIRRDMVVPDFQGSQPVIRNNGTLTITGGTILTSAQSCYGIENSGILNISGGGVTVSTEKTYGIFNNTNGEVNITDGRFQQGAVPNVPSPDVPLLVNQGKLNITGGTFINTTGNKVPSIAEITGGTSNITGGKFVYQDPNNNWAQENQDMSTLIPDNFELDRNGNVVVKQEPEQQQPEQQQPEQQEPEQQQPEQQEPEQQQPEQQEPEQQPETQPENGSDLGEEDELDETPKTGVESYLAIASLISVIACAGAVVVKKHNK